MMNVYAIWDCVADEYGPLFEAKNNKVAWRYFSDAMAQKVKNPDEYELYCVGVKDSSNKEFPYALLDMSQAKRVFPTNVSDEN